MSVCLQTAGGQFGLDALYTPVKLLGRGGTGATWLCQEVATGKQVRPEVLFGWDCKPPVRSMTSLAS